MKKIFRKNQLVITALALMIAVAGYFSYMNNNMDDGELQTAAEAANTQAAADGLEEDYDISEEDMVQNEIFTAEEPDGTETAQRTHRAANLQRRQRRMERLQRKKPGRRWLKEQRDPKCCKSRRSSPYKHNGCKY